jgi:predicted PhzF superfamily epimerase YddE/YHI9
MNLPFTSLMFYRKKAGNQLAVFLDAHSLSTEQMQHCAKSTLQKALYYKT